MQRGACIAVAFFCLVFLTAPAKAGDVLTLRNALQRAAQGNKTLDAARRALGIFEGQVLTAKAIPNPEFDVQFSQLATRSPSFSDSAKDFTLQQTIELGGKRKLRTRAAREQLSAEQSRYEALHLDIDQQVKQAY